MNTNPLTERFRPQIFCCGAYIKYPTSNRELAMGGGAFRWIIIQIIAVGHVELSHLHFFLHQKILLVGENI